MYETTLSNEEEGFILDPIDTSGQSFMFLFLTSTILFTVKYLNNI